MTDDVENVEEVTDLIEQISLEARKSFSLKDRVEGRGYREDKLTLYVDDEHAYAHSVVAKKLEEATIAEDQETVDKLTAQAEELVELTKDSAVTFTLRAYPPIVEKDIRRRTRKAFVKKGPIPEDKQDEFTELYTHYVVGASIQRVVDADGALDETDYTNHDNVKFLEDYLPRSEWQKLLDKVNEIQYTDKIGLLATSNPDF